MTIYGIEWLLAFVCPSLYFSASKPTISKRDFAAALSFLALATAAAAKMLYLEDNHQNSKLIQMNNVQPRHDEHSWKKKMEEKYVH